MISQNQSKSKDKLNRIINDSNKNLQILIQKKKQLMLKRNFHTNEEQHENIKSMITDVDLSFCDQQIKNKKYLLNKKKQDLTHIYDMIEQQKSQFQLPDQSQIDIFDYKINDRLTLTPRKTSLDVSSVQNSSKQRDIINQQKINQINKQLQDTSTPEILFNRMSDISSDRLKNDQDLIDNLFFYSATRSKSIKEKSDIYDIYKECEVYNPSSNKILRQIFESKLSNRLHDNSVQTKIFNKMIHTIQMQHMNVDSYQLNFLNEVQEQLEAGNIINKQMYQKLKSTLQQLEKQGLRVPRGAVRDRLALTRTTLEEQENLQIWKIIDSYILEMCKHQLDLNEIKEQLIKN